MTQLEELWSHCDTVLAIVPATKWYGKFGRHWEYADMPRHLAYFDHTMIAEVIMLGSSLPQEKQVFMQTHRQFNEWNNHMLAKYRRFDSFKLALEQMRQSRNEIRQAIAPLTDMDLDRPVWFPLAGFAGWQTVRYILGFCRQHTWAHFTQLCLRLNLAPWKMSTDIIHGAVDSIIHSLKPLLNNTLAQKVNFATALVIPHPGGGRWTIKVAHGKCSIQETSENKINPADMNLTFAPEILIEVLSDMRHPLTAILTGHIRIRGWRRLPTFLQLFPRPDIDQQLVPSP